MREPRAERDWSCPLYFDFREKNMARSNINQALANASAAHAAGRLTEAQIFYQQVLAEDPNHPAALQMLGVIALASGRNDDAIDLIRRAIQIKPDSAEAYNNLGSALRAKGKLDEATQSYFHAIQLKPTLASARNNLGVALAAQYQYDQAIDSYHRAIAINPEFAQAHHNLGNALGAIGKFDEAADSFRKVIALKPDNADAHLNLAMTLLMKGDFLPAWPEYEWRWKVATSAKKPQFSQPQWTGEPLEGKTILIHTEQGFGDAIQFIRFIPMLAERGPRIILQCQENFQRLFEKVSNIELIVLVGQQLPNFDFHCPLLSLPGIFGATLQTIPATVPYLKADEKLSAEWRERIPFSPGRKRVGIAWTGRALFANEPHRNRSIPPIQLAPLADLKDVDFYSLQAGKFDPQSLPPGLQVADLSGEIHDFADTAVAIENLDLIVSIDSAVAHLAGALAKPTWVLLPRLPDWRWMLGRSDSPWYPTMQLFRQETPGQWKWAIDQVVDQLKRYNPNACP
jgi:Flp pilus assembly protein TadD